MELGENVRICIKCPGMGHGFNDMALACKKPVAI
jgi:hypothetical protein